MNEQELTRLKALTGCADSDLLTALYEDAEEKVLAMTGRTKVIRELLPAIRELTVCNYNRAGSEGMASRSDSEVGISSSFEDIPETIAHSLYRYRLARVNGAYLERGGE